jgi:hypothetical protein
LDRTLVAGLAAGVSDHAGLVVTLAQHFADVIKISTQLIPAHRNNDAPTVLRHGKEHRTALLKI